MPLRLILLVLLLLFLLYVIWTPWRRGEGMTKFRGIIVILLVALFLQQSWMEYQWFTLQQKMSSAARLVVNSDATVYCQRLNETMVWASASLGHVRFGPDGVPEKATMMTWETCEDVKAWFSNDMREATRDQIIATHVLVHEAVHMSGVTNEAVTECYAMQLYPQVLLTMGVERQEARRMSDYYVESIYPQMYDSYRTSECAKGGKLDLSPKDKVWPDTTLAAYEKYLNRRD